MSESCCGGEGRYSLRERKPTCRTSTRKRASKASMVRAKGMKKD